MSEQQNYMVIESGGRQLLVREGTRVRVPKLGGEKGQALKIEQVKLTNEAGKLSIGTPLVSGASVDVQILGHVKSKKTIAFHKKRRKGQMKKTGHRQEETEIVVNSFSFPK